VAKKQSKPRNRTAGIESVKRRIVPLSEADPYLKILVYGRNGQGKTRLGGSGPRPFVLDCNDHGTKSIRSQPGDAFFADTWEDVVFAYWFLKQGNHDYETLVLDNVTMMQNLCSAYVLKEIERDGLRDPKTASQREWGKIKQYMGPQLLDFRNLPMHVVFIAQERTVDNDDEERTERVPDLSPGVRAYATSCVDIIGRMLNRPLRRVNKDKKAEVVEWHNVLFTGETDDYVTKDRDRYIPRGVMVDPTIPKIVDAMKGKVDEPKPKKSKGKRK
jgi:hypothetical protein